MVTIHRASQVAQWEGIPLQCRRCRFHAWFRKSLWRRKWQPTPIFLPGKSRGQRSLSGYNPWGCKESDTPEWLSMCIIPYLDKKMSLGYYNLCKLCPYFHVRVLQGKKKKSTFSTKLNLSWIEYWFKTNLRRGSNKYELAGYLFLI